MEQQQGRKTGKEEKEMVGKIQMEAERKIAKLNKRMKLQTKEKEGLPTDNLRTIRGGGGSGCNNVLKLTRETLI